jgi:NAD(P)-dependent dehydrogenase (short-subunit alcohol dehydrogenase family)
LFAAAADYRARYDAYFDANDARLGGGRRRLDPAPRVVLAPGLGLFGLGRTAKDAAIAADLAEITIETVAAAERIGRFEPLPAADLFEMEYWSLEQAKLGKSVPKPLEGQVAVVTGGGGAIGAATARLFAASGAEVAVLDIEKSKAEAVAAAIGGRALALGCDVTDRGSVALAYDEIVRRFGGVDLLVSNAGAAFEGAIAEIDEALLRRSFEINFFAHQIVAQAAVAIMKKQGTGGALLFNVSKQAVNPGENFGAYGAAKAACLFLARQYALEGARFGVRANMVNADRIRSGLLDDAMIDRRSAARGVSRDVYMSGNLLGREVTAEDVAQAFLNHALALKTTGDVTTVDGGNVAAMLR